MVSEACIAVELPSTVGEVRIDAGEVSVIVHDDEVGESGAFEVVKNELSGF